MSAALEHVEHPASARVPESFRSWWQSYRTDMSMQARQSPFIVGWWRDLRPSLRAFLAAESGVERHAEAAAARWDTIPADDQARILVAARLLVSELKPASWL